MRKACLILVLLVGFLAFSTASVLAVDSSNGKVDGVCPPTVVRACLEQQCPSSPNDADCVARCNDQCTNMLIEAPVPKWQFPSFQNWSDDVLTGEDITSRKINMSSLMDNVYGPIAMVIGPLETNPSGATTTRGGAINFFAANIDSMIQTRPVSGTQFIASTLERLRVPGAAPVYAVGVGGTGYSALTPVLQLWTLTRNLAYLFFAVAFVVVGIMIIMRKKIDQKNALSIQMALPKIIIALVLVTFSYAIAGFLIDLMYILIGILFTIFGTINATKAQEVRDIVMNDVILVAAFKIELGSITTQFSGVNNAIYDMLNNILGNVKNQNIVINVLSGAGSTLGAALFMLIIVFAMLWAVFQIWLKLLIAYVRIVIYVIAAPLMLMLDAIPGQNQFGKWIMALLADILLFPVTIVLMLLGVLLSLSYSSSNGVGFIPPLIGLGNTAVIPTLLGFGILLSIPKVLDELPKMLKVQPNPLGDAWKDAAKWGYNTAPNPVRAGQEVLQDREAIKQQKRKEQVSRAAEGVHPRWDSGMRLRRAAANFGLLNPAANEYDADRAANDRARGRLLIWDTRALGPRVAPLAYNEKRCPEPDCGSIVNILATTCPVCAHTF